MKGLKKTAAVLCILLLLLSAAACAEGRETDREELGIPPNETFAVLSAPFDDAWRGTEERDSFGVPETFTLIGSARGNEWLMISFDIDGESRKIGWIRTPNGFDAEGEIPELSLEGTLYRVTKDSPLTDDPEKSRRSVGTLAEGESVTGMLRTRFGDTEWVYVETETEGKTAWAFTEAGSLEEEAPYYREDDRIVIREGVALIGIDYEDRIPLQPGDVCCGFLDVFSEFGTDIRTIDFPSTLRGLGEEAIVHAYLKELTLPDTLIWISENALSYGSAERVVLKRGYAAGIPGGSDFSAGFWEVEEGNAVYSSRDGVLFTAGGRTLLDYPDGKTELHYDVPAGTEEIGPSAFCDGWMGIPLQTISLPVGLKKIGAWAFSGCGRLHSLTVPLTVTEVDPTAFAQCVSLERLSLPPGITVPRDVIGAEREDFSNYTGDNGATLTKPRDDGYGRREKDGTEASVSYAAWLSGENGEGPVPLYPSKDADTPSREEKSGTEVIVSAVGGSRAKTLINYRKEFWTDLKYILPKVTDAFFTVAEAVPNEEGRRVLAEEGMESAVFGWFDEDTAESVFTQPGSEDGPETYLSLDQVILRREYTGDARELAFLYAVPRDTPILLRGAPDGEVLSWTYSGEQAEILKRGGEWAYIRTAGGRGWVPESCLIVIEQMKPDN